MSKEEITKSDLINALKNPEYFKNNEDIVIKSSFAACRAVEKFVKQIGDPTKFANTEDMFAAINKLPYKDIINNAHNMYKLDRGGDVNPYLVQDLSSATLLDICDGAIDCGTFTITDKSKFLKGEIMQTPHNSKSNGIPNQAFEKVDVSAAKARLLARKGQLKGKKLGQNAPLAEKEDRSKNAKLPEGVKPSKAMKEWRKNGGR